MRKKLTAIGNSVGLIIDKPILELLGLEKDDEIEVTTDGQRLILTPKSERRRRLLAATERVMKEHEETFRRLGD